MSTFHGIALFVQFLVASYFAARSDWNWFAAAALGCFVIYAYGRDA